MRKSIRPIVTVLVLFIVIGAIFFAGKPQPSSAQNAPFKSYQLRVFCGNSAIPTEAFWHDVGEDSMGVNVRCAGNCPGGKVPLADALAGLPAKVSAALNAMVEKHQENAAAGKGRSLTCLRDGKEPPKPRCDPDPYPDYLRKRQISLELFKHASDLRLTASKLVAERWGAESENLRIEAEKEVAGDLAWEQYGPQVTKKLGQTRGALSETWVARQAVKNAPFAVKAWNAVGWIDIAVQTTYRGLVTAGDWSDYQKEAQKATKEAEEMWRKALADIEASLKQAPDCLEASRAAAEEEKNLDRAKAAIEKWDNNQNLYWDPIRNEAVTFEAALKRADTYLKSGKISQIFHKATFKPMIFITDDEPTQQSLAAAIRELDKAIPSFGRLNGSVAKYLRTQRSIERELEAAFGGKTNTEPELLIPKGKSPKKKSGMRTKRKVR